MVMVPKLLSLRASKAPNLLIAPVQYDQRYQDQLNNALRLYFNELDNLTASLFNSSGGTAIKFPYGAFYDTTNQYDGSTTVPYAVRLNSTSYTNGVTVTSRNATATGSISTTTMTVTAVLSGRFYPGMLLSSTGAGTNVTAGSYVYLQTSSTAAAVATPSYDSLGGVGTNTVVLTSVTGIEERQFVSGTGVPANTRVVYVDTLTKTVTLSANFTVQASGTYTFRPWGYEGTYSVSPSQTVTSRTILGTTQSMVTFQYPGLYNVQYSLQFTNTDLNTIHEVDVWVKKNYVNIADSNSQFSVPGKHSGSNGQLIAALNFFVDVVENDVIEIAWHTTNSQVFIETIPAATSPVRPEIPSAIVTVQFVSELPQ